MKNSIEELIETVKSRRSHVLVVSGNVYDEVRVGSQTFADLGEFATSLTSKTFPNCLSYDLFSGLKVVRGDEKAIAKSMGLSAERNKTDDPLIAALQQQSKSAMDRVFPINPLEVFTCLDRFLERTDKPMVLLIDYADSVIPAQNHAGNQPAERILGVALTKWSRNQKIRAAGHLILLITRHKEELDKLLVDRVFETVQVRITKPEEKERAEFFESLRLPKNQAGILAKAASGLSLKDLKDVSGLEQLFAIKRKILGEEYGDLLEIMQTKNGFESIGGLEKPIAKLKEVAQAMREGKTSLAPQGILFMGPPGTGKTVLAEAFAKEAGLNFVKPLDIKSMWVGESERRMSRFLNALKDLAPVVVFIDEFDQNQGQRGGFDGDSGTSRGLFKKMLEIMSDTSLRGKILWIMATNRPDLIDGALKRPGRCDLRIPFLPPDTAQLALICRAAFRQYPEMRSKIESWTPYAEQCFGYSGADMIEVVRRAWEHANACDCDKISEEDMKWACDDYRPQSLNRLEVVRMTLLALVECSSKSLMPDNWETLEADYYEELFGARPEKGSDTKQSLIGKILKTPNNN